MKIVALKKEMTSVRTLAFRKYAKAKALWQLSPEEIMR